MENIKLNLPKVSIIVTNYNYAGYIIDCLQSIHDQTYQNIECIIIDDSSTDNSVELINKFIENNSAGGIKFLLLKNDKNIGQFGSFKKGIQHSTGEFISFIDSDDKIFDNYVNYHIQMHFKECVALTVCNLIEIDQNNTIHTINSISFPQISGNRNRIKKFKIETINTFNEFINGINPDSKKIESKIIDAKTHPFGGWYWAPTSCGMMRKASINLLQYENNIDDWNICADKYLFNYAHLIGGSAVFNSFLVAYRRHDNNNFAFNYVTGDRKYFSDKMSDLLRINNQKIATNILRFFIENREKCIENFGLNGLKDISLKVSNNLTLRELKENFHLYKKIFAPRSDKQINILLFTNNFKYKIIKLYLKFIEKLFNKNN